MSVPRSKIGWCDYSGGDLNFVTGCTPVSAGCKNCYAEAIYKRFGRDFTVQCYPDKLERLLKWQPKPPFKRGGDRALAFVCDTGDLMHNAVSELFARAAFFVMQARPDIDFCILTKRAERMNWLLTFWQQKGYWKAPAHMWLGVTVENQKAADERIPLLLQTPAAVRFISVEPMLGPVELDLPSGYWEPDEQIWLPGVGGYAASRPAAEPEAMIDWVICGAESGPKRRPFDAQWALSLYEQCREADVPFFYKQGSALKPGQDAELPGFGVVQEWPDARLRRANGR